jgi:hypothetical protein
MKMPYEDYNNQGLLSEEQVFFAQQMKIGQLSTMIHSDTTSSWQRNTRNFIEAVDCYESMTTNYLDREYYQKLQIYKEMFRKKNKEFRDKNPITFEQQAFDNAMSLRFTHFKYSLIQRSLKRSGLYAKRVISEIINKEGEV